LNLFHELPLSLADMKWRHPFRPFVGLCVAALLAATGLSASGESPALPDWLAGKESLMPPVPPSTIDAMRVLLKKINTLEEVDVYNAHPSAEDLDTASKIIALGEGAGNALVWFYVEPLHPLGREDFEKCAHEKAAILGHLCHDPIVAKWMLPILREHLSYFEGHLKDPHFFETVMSLKDIQSMSVYLDSAGRFDVRQNFRHFQDQIEEIQGQYPYPYREHPGRRRRVGKAYPGRRVAVQDAILQEL
jgi:hypothetical protein